MTSNQELASFYRGTRVVVTGHTGFKGAWLTLALAELGATVTGIALPADADGVFALGAIDRRVDSHLVDIRDRSRVQQVLREADPQVVFHLAAQSLVPTSFREPVETFDVNVVGTAVLLAACDTLPSLRSVVVVTSDKVYENRGTGRAFVESDRLGAGDPYSTSKAAAELVVESWRHSFGPTHDGTAHRLGSARAGNVIGGGDRALDRVVPDTIRALTEGRPVELRNPGSVRPWQHVLEPVLGYLAYAAELARGTALARGAGQGAGQSTELDTDEVPAALNFGPDPTCTSTVGELVDRVVDRWGSGSWSPTAVRPGPEAQVLLLDSSLAGTTLGWRPVLDLDAIVRMTVDWYRCAADRKGCEELTLQQLHGYLALTDGAAEGPGTR